MYIAVRDQDIPSIFGNIAPGLREMDISAVELEFYRDLSLHSLNEDVRVPVWDPEDLVSYQDKIGRLDIEVAALLLHNDFSRDDIEKEIDWVTKCIQIAAKLHVKAVRIDAIMEKHGEWGTEKCIDTFARCMQQVLENTQQYDVEMGIENHGKIGNDPEFLDKVIEKVGSNKVGITLDTANFYWSGMPLERVHETIEHFAPVVKHTHIKNINYPIDVREKERETGWEYSKYASDLEEGDINIERVVKALKNAGYTNSLCIENESVYRKDDKEKKNSLIRDAQYLKKLIAAV